MNNVYDINNIYVSIELSRDTLYPSPPKLVREDVNYIIGTDDIYPTEEEWKEAIKILIRKMYYDKADNLSIDVHRINDFCAPPKEMTIDEVERELGYKVKIVDTKENI